MKIFPAEIAAADGQITVTYRYETPSRPSCHGAVWFRVAERQRDWLAPGPEPAVAALLFLAMALGEDIEVEQPVSPHFAYGFRQFVAHFQMWMPAQLARVKLRVPGFVPHRPAGGNVVSCFSGGVDSFVTLHDHLPPVALPGHGLTHLLFAGGFDVPLADRLYDELSSEFSILAAKHGLGFVGLSTNVRGLLDPHVPWVNSHGACLAACALVLGGGISRFIIPSTNRQSLLFAPCGSNPVTDPMLGTESLEVLHHGTHLSRIQKILAIADSADAREYLRVCWQNIPGRRNCGRCVKCLKTMMPLEIAGVLHHFAVFPPLPPWREIPAACFAPLNLSRYAPELGYAEELRALAAARGYKALHLS